MNNFYANVQAEIMDFIDRCHNSTNPMNISSIQSSIPCLTTISFDTFSFVTQHLNKFINFLSSYTSDMSIKYDQIISIVSNCSDLINCINTYQYLFIEYAIDDYFYLDEHFDLIYQNILKILNYLHNLSTINSDIYNFEKELRCYLPSNYLNYISSSSSSSLSTQIASSLIDQTSQLFLSSYNSLLNNHNEDNNNNNNNDCIIPSSFLFSILPITINIDNYNRIKNYNDNYHHSESLLQLDKINIHTTILTHSQLTSSFQFDFNDFEQIENDLKKENLDNKYDWINIEREFFMNIISIWSNKNLTIHTINPWSSEIFWTLIMHFKCSDMNLKYEFILIVQWCLCLLTIQAFNRDWDLFFSKTLINTIITNRWGTICFFHNIHLSIVGHNLNQMFLRLIRITSVLQYMKILSEQSSYLTSFLTNIISSNINHLMKQIEGTFQLLITWLNQHADTFINGNSLERTLVICKSDQIQLSITIKSLIDSLRQLQNCEQTINLVNKLHSSCETIVNETMSKLYRRIKINTTNHFDITLPPTTNEMRTINQQRLYMVIACDKILKPILSQCECLNIEKKFNIYEQIFSSFVEGWTSILRERKYHFSDEMIIFLQKDYEYLQTFLSTTISDEEIIQLLNKSSSIEEISMIIDLLRKGGQNGSNTSLSNIPNHDKWFRSRKSSSQFLQFFQYACCCQRRNRVMTNYS
ncbi:unnamed protein product [Rotaria sordida]|nr:unnamed protein product [Rotaria sordida]